MGSLRVVDQRKTTNQSKLCGSKEGPSKSDVSTKVADESCAEREDVVGRCGGTKMAPLKSCVSYIQENFIGIKIRFRLI